MKISYSWFDAQGHLIQIDEAELREAPDNAVRGTFAINDIVVDDVDLLQTH